MYVCMHVRMYVRRHIRSDDQSKPIRLDFQLLTKLHVMSLCCSIFQTVKYHTHNSAGG